MSELSDLQIIAAFLITTCIVYIGFSWAERARKKDMATKCESGE